MPRPIDKGAADEFGGCRARQQARGLKLLRVWVPDPRAPGFREEARRQAARLRGAPEEAEALALIEAEADIGEP